MLVKEEIVCKSFETKVFLLKKRSLEIYTTLNLAHLAKQDDFLKCSSRGCYFKLLNVL